MTEITLAHSDNSLLIKARGHSTGSQEVCSGISAILYMVAGYLDNHSFENKCDLAPGDALIEFEETDETLIIYEAASIGLLLIENTYPDYVKVDIVGGEN